MANIYVRSTDGSDSDNGTTWALAKATIVGALAAASAGDTIWVSHVHAETPGSTQAVTSPGTADNPCYILCGNDAAEPPTALATTATASISGNFAWQFAGYCYCYGVAFSTTWNNVNCFTFTSNASWWWKMEACGFQIAGSGARISVGNNSTAADDQLLELVNTTMIFGNTQNGIILRCPFVWRDTPSALSGTVPSVLFPTVNQGFSSFALINNVDLSSVNTALAQVGVQSCNDYRFENCKLNASVALTTGTPQGQGGVEAWLINCDSADTNNRFQHHCYQGDVYQETTVVRSGGASDGTTPFSRKMVSSANSKFVSPLESDQMLFWNESTGSSLTATVEIVNDGSTLLNGDVWLEVEYSSDSSTPLYSTITDAKTLLGIPANQTSSSVTWTTTGLSSPVTQKLEVTFTPQNKGIIKAKVCLAKPSTTVYFCPKIEVA